MRNHPRAIVLLTINDKRSISTTKFGKSTYLGDPINILRILNDKYADEVCIIDIGSMKSTFALDFEYLKELSSECHMPLSYGGGVTSIASVEKILDMGFEKIVINRMALENPSFVTTLSETFGSQSIVVSIDIKNCLLSRQLKIFTKANLHASLGKKNPKEVAELLFANGAGEVLFQHVDRDGTRTGLDKRLIMLKSSLAGRPVIMSGGIKNIDEVKSLTDSEINIAGCSAFTRSKFGNGILVSYPAL